MSKTEERCCQAIYCRKSVRKYKPEPLDGAMLESLRGFLDNMTPLYPEIKTDLRIVSPEDIRTLMPTKAAHFLLGASETREGYLENMGFLMQQADLFLSANNMGSCWIGMAKAARPLSVLEYVIVLSFGRADEPVHRVDCSQFKRRPESEISRIDGDLGEALRAVRLAPSSTNSQPWFFTGTPEQIHVWRARLNPLKAAVYEKMNRIDMGIALCHLWLALRREGARVAFGPVSSAPEPPKGYQYVATCTVER